MVIDQQLMLWQEFGTGRSGRGTFNVFERE